ncbi:MAG: hypothetical protein ACAH83_07260 [Alphaproteobacteria bacterium]
MADKNKDKDGKTPPTDKDAVDKLSLSIIPLTSSSLKSSRLIKNTRLETMLELHSDSNTGSLQIRPEDIPATFPGTSKSDQDMIAKLAELKSYDVYSLRVSLKKLGIDVDPSLLALSDDTKDRLDRYSQEFTRPLILSVFGDGTGTQDMKALHKVFNEPDVAVVQERLKGMSQKTGIPIEGLPVFLQGYRDLFLSTLYYRENFETLVPDINRFWLWLAELKTQREVTTSAGAMESCRKVMGALRFLFISTRERLAKFRNEFEMFWSDMNRESFERLRKEIEDNHISMGAVLCGLSVKMRDWSSTFPDGRAVGPSTRVQYVMGELEPGLEQLMALENKARQEIGMNAVAPPSSEEIAALKILSLLLGEFKCLSGDVLRLATFLKAWKKDNEASHLDIRRGLAFAAKQGWIDVVEEDVSYRLTEAGFDKGITLSTKA